jgi:hypothetical protein
LSKIRKKLFTLNKCKFLFKFAHHFSTLFKFQEADPATIRPLSVLERAFSFVMNKYRLQKDGSYISDQLKSIRQDLMVQAIRNDFTVLVYEENARISLLMVRLRFIFSEE